MDALSSILKVTKLAGVVCDKLIVSGPWGLDVIQTENAQFWRLLKGSCVVALLDGQSVLMKEGDIVIIPHGASHWIADRESSHRVTPKEYVKTILEGNPIFNGDGDETIIVGGHFSFEQNQSHPFVRDLPAIIRISQFGTRYEQLLQHTGGLMISELNEQNPGSELMRKSLAEILFVAVIRAYLEQAAPEKGFLAALTDPQISNALKLMHEKPENDWTLESLASSVAMSRSVFAGRFKKLVGETPLTYLTDWRINRASELLISGNTSIEALASRVGYQSEQAFIRVFKTKTGQTPAAFRRTMTLQL